MLDTDIVHKTPFISSESFNNAFKESTYSNPQLLYGIKKEIAELDIRLELFRIVSKHFRNPITCIKVLKKLDTLRRQVLGENRLKKIVKVNNKYYWDLYTPGCNSKAFTKYVEGEINRFSRLKQNPNQFTNVFFAITKKCSLRCEHCYEWDVLNNTEKLSLKDLKLIVQNLQSVGVGQIQFSGGEPLLRIKDLVDVMRNSDENTEFWINSSGHMLTFENARLLKDNGLMGAVISLDHFDKDKHNAFRGNRNSYQWVVSALKNAQANGIVTGLSICVTRAFISKENLMSYMDLAKQLNVSFVQILEPRAVGHYKGKSVSLDSSHLKLLEDLYLNLNYNAKFKDYPIITYHGFHQRRLGCFASGNRSFYIDTDGDIHACPFCQLKTGSALSSDFMTTLTSLRQNGCHSFAGSTI